MSQTAPLSRILEPDTIAVIGASDRPESRGYFVWQAVSAERGARPVWPVNPKYRYIGETPCYASIEKLPGPVELAVLTLASPRIVPALEALGRQGCRAVVVAPEEEHLFVEERAARAIRETARRFGMRVIGPDSIGLVNPAANVNASFWPEMPAAGNVALVTQSGLVATAFIDAAADARIGFSGVVNSGSEIDLTAADWIDHFRRDPRTRVIAVQIEGLRSPRTFAEALAAAAREKRVVVLRAGPGTGFAADRLACYRFGTDAGRDEVFDALIRQSGAVRVRDFSEFVSAASVFATCSPPYLAPERTSCRIAILSNDSGFASIAVEEAHQRGLELSGLSNETIHALKKTFPSPQLPVNPVVVGAASGAARLGRTLDLILRDPGIDAALVVVAPGPSTPVGPTVRQLSAAARTSFKPVVLSAVSDRAGQAVHHALAAEPNTRMAALRSPRAAVGAIALLAEEAYLRRNLKTAPGKPFPELPETALDRVRTLLRLAAEEDRFLLNLREAAPVLEAAGIRTLPSHPAENLEKASALARSIGGPVTLKFAGDGFGRKTERGALYLNLTTPAELENAWERLERRFGRKALAVGGVIVEPMLEHSPLREFRFALGRDPVLGPWVEFGLGGEVGEVCGESTTLLPPVSSDAARRAVQKVVSAAAFGPWRGLEPVPVDAMAALLERLCSLTAAVPALYELRLDPVVPTTEGPTVLNAVIRLCEGDFEPAEHFPHLLRRAASREVRVHEDRTGARWCIRALGEKDFEGVRQFIAELSDESFFLRFHSSARLSEERVAALCRIDWSCESAWVVEDAKGRPAGIARWKRTEREGDAEFGVVVRDDLKRRGLASALMRILADTARREGLSTLTGYVLHGNEAMDGLMRRLGFRPQAHSESGACETVAWRLTLDPALAERAASL